MLAVILLAALVLVACEAEGIDTEPDPDLTFDPGAVEDREALFDFLVESTMAWDAFATLSEHPVHREHPAGLDVVAEMEKYRHDLLNADTDSAFYYALLKISNARKDRHLRIGPVEGGLTFPDTVGIQESQANAPVRDSRLPRAPVNLRVDYGDLEARFLFVADRSVEAGEGAYGEAPEPGNRVMAINGMPIEEYIEAIRPYHRYSTENSFWWWAAFFSTQRSVQFPDSFYGASFTLRLEGNDGSEYEVDLPYLDPREIEWEGHSERQYPGFTRIDEVSGYDTFDFYLPDGDDLPLVLLDWYGFQSDLPEAIDALMEYAEEHELLDRHVIVDATRGSGGSRGSYAVQRLQPEPHRGTFGNLMVSEVMERWVEDQVAGLRDGSITPASIDDGTWLLEWLEDDVQKAIDEGRMYTNNVPFKGAHAPKWSDGILEPADVHFRGGLTVWLGPKGGSHLDQFAAQVVDNDLGHVMGMAAGGYSNTWQASETLRFPTTGKPIVTYQWSLGHSIRPNGQVLQYNPAEPHEYIPVTRDNYFAYHPELLRRTLERLGF